MRADDRPEKLPNFLAQETGGMQEYLSMLFRLYSYKKGQNEEAGGIAAEVEEWDRQALAEERIKTLCEHLVADFVEKEAVVRVIAFYSQYFDCANSGLMVLSSRSWIVREACPHRSMHRKKFCQWLQSWCCS